MKFSESWLREWVNPNISTAELAEQLTMAGLEVDAIESVAGEFSGVVVGEILAVEQHPDADKLRVCQVAGGDKVAQVVCGAPNARAGIKVPFATVGAVLPGNFKIKKAKLRGVESFGMLCAQTELNAGDDDSGLWELASDAPTGAPLQDYLSLNDAVIEVDLTPNRGDCLGISGIAREVGVINRQDLTVPAMDAVAPQVDDTFPVELQAPEHCSRYVGRVIRGVDLSVTTPLWMQEKLRRSGVRSIDPVVDITNYVMLELGQPMHAFDLSQLDGGICVRLAEKGEVLTLLDEQEVKLTEDSLVIADQSKTLALGGIMGGKDSGVSPETKDVFLECAYFDAVKLAGKARHYGLHTDASHRYERGVDYNLQEQAVERATQLLLDIVGGKPGPAIVTEVDAHVPDDRNVQLRKARIERGLGFSLDDTEVEEILTRLGLKIESRNAEGWTFAVPSYRFDIAIEADLMEELARIYGYNQLPVTSMVAELEIQPQQESKQGLQALQQLLVSRGYQEAICYSFVSPELQKLFDPEVDGVALKNPISADMAVMRTNLWPGLIGAMQHNLNRQQSRVRLFETGQRFVPTDDGLSQEPVLAALITGPRQPESWDNSKDSVDFYDLKGDIEALIASTGCFEDFNSTPDSHPALHPGQCARIEREGKPVGLLGALHPSVARELGVSQGVYLLEVTLKALQDAVVPEFDEMSKFPGVRRDLAVIVDQSISSANLLKKVRENAGTYLKELKVFDVYVGKGIDPHRKSVALGLTFQYPSRTLNEDEINASVEKVVGAIKETFDATLR